MKILSAIKKDLEFNKSLSTLIETLKTIAVSQFRTLEQKTKTFQEFFSTIQDFLSFIDIKDIKHPFLNSDNRQQLIIAITSDAGFLGGLNMQVVGTAINELEKMPGKLIIIGERGKMYVHGGRVSTVNFPGINDEERYTQAMQIRDYLVNKVLSGSFGGIKIVYPRPISFTVQRVETISILPYAPVDIKETQRDLIPDIIMESNPGDVLEYLVGLWMGQRIYDIFGLSRLAEFAARYIHLEESAQKLRDIDEKVKLEYFRVRHELVDRTMRELFAGRLLYAR